VRLLRFWNWRAWDVLTGVIASVFIAWLVIRWARWNGHQTTDDTADFLDDTRDHRWECHG